MRALTNTPEVQCCAEHMLLDCWQDQEGSVLFRVTAFHKYLDTVPNMLECDIPINTVTGRMLFSSLKFLILTHISTVCSFRK